MPVPISTLSTSATSSSLDTNLSSTSTSTTTKTATCSIMDDLALFSDHSRQRSASASTTDSTSTARPISVSTAPSDQRPTAIHPPLNTTFLGIPHPRFKESVVQFLGIKYAHVPLRWRQARLWTTYAGLLTDAGKYGPICPQPTRPAQTPEELIFGTCPSDLASTHYPLPAHDEFECLNLNITAPKGLNPHARLPVMVWVHGGGHRGSGSEWYYDPGSIVEKSVQSGQPVIWVTINFRIGLLGWATCPSIRDDNKAVGEEGAANFGLHDQRKALEWIHHYIAPFGGDPHNVTLIGAGTGAADIVYHLLSRKNGDAGGAHPYCPFVSTDCDDRCYEIEDIDASTSAPDLFEVQEEDETTRSGTTESLLNSSKPYFHAYPTQSHPHPHPHHPYRLFERAILQSPIFETVLADVNTAGWHLQRIMGALGITGCGGVNSKEGLEKLRGVDVSSIVNLGCGSASGNSRNPAAAASAAAAAMSLRVVDDGDWFRDGWQSFFKKEGGWKGKGGPVVSRHGHDHRSCSRRRDRLKSHSRSRSKRREEGGCRSGGRSTSRTGRSTNTVRKSGRSTSRNATTRPNPSDAAHPMPFTLGRDYEDPNKDNTAALFPCAFVPMMDGSSRCQSCGLECENCAKPSSMTRTEDSSATMYAQPRESRSVVHASSSDFYSANLKTTLGTMNTDPSDESVLTDTSISSEGEESPHVLIQPPVSKQHLAHSPRVVCGYHSPFIYSHSHHHGQFPCTDRRSRSRSGSHPHVKHIKTPMSMLQPIIIGDSPADSLLWAHPISYWTATGVVRRLKAICASAGGTSSYAYSTSSAATATTSTVGGGVSSYLAASSHSSYSSSGTSSLGLSNNLLRAYELSSYVEDDEVGERVGEMVQDTRIGWGVELVDRGVRRERGGAGIASGHGSYASSSSGTGGSEKGGVWRYVFDQEGFGIGGPEQGDCANAQGGSGGGLRGSPHYAADLVYLFDHTPVVAAEDEGVDMDVDTDTDLDQGELNRRLQPGSGTPTQRQTKSRTRSQTQTTATMLSPETFAEGAWAETFDVDSDSDEEMQLLHDGHDDALALKAGRDEEPGSVASLINVSQLSDKLEAHMDGSSGSTSTSTMSSITSSTTFDPNLTSSSNPQWVSSTANAWLETPITPYTYNRVSCTLIEKWLRFSYGIAPWNDTKVFVFGPEGEVGERSREIFEARRKVKVWEDVLGPLGWSTVLKVGVELSRGPVG